MILQMLYLSDILWKMKSSQVTSVLSDWTMREMERLLGLALRSVRDTVDRGELVAWKAIGGARALPAHPLSAGLTSPADIFLRLQS